MPPCMDSAFLLCLDFGTRGYKAHTGWHSGGMSSLHDGFRDHSIWPSCSQTVYPVQKWEGGSLTSPSERCQLAMQWKSIQLPKLYTCSGGGRERGERGARDRGGEGGRGSGGRGRGGREGEWREGRGGREGEWREGREEGVEDKEWLTLSVQHTQSTYMHVYIMCISRNWKRVHVCKCA